MAKNLSSKILEKLEKKTGRNANAIRVALTRIRHKHPSITLNAAAQRFASDNGFNVFGMLDDEDRASLPTVAQMPSVRTAAIIPRNVKRAGTQKQLVVVLNYHTTDPFGKKHIEEANKAYNAGCYTAAVILCRKIFENILINDVLLKQFPEKSKENRELYFDTTKKRFKDFSVIEANFYTKRNEFPASCLKPIERLHMKLGVFLKDANDHTHSWYHVCNKTEFDAMNVQEMADLFGHIRASIEASKS